MEIYLYDQEQPVKGYLITCSLAYCAFLVKNQVVVVNHEKIEKLVSQNRLLQRDMTPAMLEEYRDAGGKEKSDQ